MKNVIEDLSTLTTIPVTSLAKLIDKSILCIEDEVLNSFLNNEDIISLNIGIGKLVIKIEENLIRYRFIPSKKLEDGVKEALASKKSSLETTVEQHLIDKILKTYKDLF